MKSEVRVGIDLGTTNSAVAVLQANQPVLIPNSSGRLLTPSQVAILADGRAVVGEGARHYRLLHPDCCAASFKRLMGTNTSIDLGTNRQWTAVELSSLVLAKLKRDAEAYLRAPVREAVITVPAYFNESQRRATEAAAELAGLKTLRLINEPTAAALAYGFAGEIHLRHLAVLDLGGGTFDVTVLRVFHGISEVVASGGESDLGGEEITRSLLEYLAQSDSNLRAEAEDPRLLVECERLKQALSDVPEVDGTFLSSGGKTLRFSLDSQALETASRPYFNRMRTTILRVLDDAGMEPASIDAVVLAGGATRMPLVKNLAAQLFEKSPMTKLSPDYVVAQGAALQAAVCGRSAAVEDLVMTDVCPWSLGIAVVKDLGRRKQDGYFAPLIHRNTTLPCSREDYFATVRDNQTTVHLRIFQGESRYVEENLEIGELILSGLPRGPSGQNFAVRFTYDVSGLLEVEALGGDDARANKVILHRSATADEAELERARKRLAAVRFFPQDDLEHLELLARGSNAVSAVQPSIRAKLERLVDAFEAALYQNDRQLFSDARNALEEILDSIGAIGPAPTVH